MVPVVPAGRAVRIAIFPTHPITAIVLPPNGLSSAVSLLVSTGDLAFEDVAALLSVRGYSCFRVWERPGCIRLVLETGEAELQSET